MRTTFFAPCTLGLEPALEHELFQLGALEIATRPGGVRFRGDRRLGYAANLWLRSAIRVQELVSQFRVTSRDDLYDAARSIDWREYMSLQHTLAVDGSVQDSEIRHSKFAALVVKDAIVDQFRDRDGRRPNVDRLRPTLPLKVVIRKHEGQIWRNMSGASLHKRGWRPIQVKSPLNEATAAGLLLLTGWDRQSSLADPMCGSGTFVIEAAMLAANMAPGRQREFPFERWPDFDSQTWHELKREAADGIKRELPFSLEGADRHGGAIELARKGARAAGVDRLVRFECTPIAKWRPTQTPATVIVNPPYGKRLEQDDLAESWHDLGTFLHERARGATAWVLSGNREVTRHLRLRAADRFHVKNADIDCRFLRYEIGKRATKPSVGAPSRWVERFADRVPRGGCVLDVACGSGRHTRLFLERGHSVVAVDRDVAGIEDLRTRRGLEIHECDLESAEGWPFEAERFDAIVVTNYLWRPLLPHIVKSLRPGGVLLYETFAVGQEQLGKPTNPDFLLRPNELLSACGDDVTVHAYEHGEFREPDPVCRQRIFAIRDHTRESNGR